MVLIDACAGLVRGIGVEPDAWRELTLRYLSDPHPAAATGEDLDANCGRWRNGACPECAGMWRVLKFGRRARKTRVPGAGGERGVAFRLPFSAVQTAMQVQRVRVLAVGPVGFGDAS